MQKRRYTYLIVLASIALLGSIGVQLLWIVKGYNQAKSHLEDQLELALSGAIDEINTAEEIAFIAQVGSDVDSAARQEVHSYHFVKSTEVSWSDSTASGSTKTVIDVPPKGQYQRRIEINDDQGSVKIEVIGSDGEVVQEEVAASEEEIMVNAVMAMEERGKLEDVVRRIQMENFKERGDWKERLDSAQLSTCLKEEMADLGLNDPFSFALVNAEGVPFEGFKAANYDTSSADLQAKRSLFPADLKSKGVYLDLRMTASFASLFQEVWLLAFLSMIFTLTMLLLFVLFWRKLLSQSRLSQMKSDFINNMSHELKTPLATISLAADAILHPRSGDDRKTREELIGTIKKEQQRIQHHIDRVLNMAQSEAKGLELQLETAEMNDWLGGIIRDFQPKAKQSGHQLVFKSLEENLMLQMDPLHLQGAIENLLDNAVKYNPEGTNVSVELALYTGYIEILVEDDGVGIDPGHHAHLFDPFYRVQSGNIHDVKGFGLGLSYVAEVVQAHAGTLHIESEAAQGTRFKISLPK